MTAEETRWVGTGEACRILGISRSTMLAAEQAGLIRAARTPGGHRRFTTGDLERYLGRALHQATPTPPPMSQTSLPPDMVMDIRKGLRELVQAVDAVCAAAYDMHDGSLRYCSGFGIPRWLSDRLRRESPPQEIVKAIAGTAPHRIGYDGWLPQLKGGPVVTCPLPAEGEVVGVMAVVMRADHEFLAGELRIVEVCRVLLGMVIARDRRVVELRQRLALVRDVSGDGTLE